MTFLSRLTLLVAGAFGLTYFLGFRRGFYFCQDDIRERLAWCWRPYWQPAGADERTVIRR